MSDKEMNNMGMEEQERLGQMVTEALLRDARLLPTLAQNGRSWQHA